MTALRGMSLITTKKGSVRMRTAILSAFVFIVWNACILAQGSGTALWFDGVDDYVEMPHNFQGFGITDSFTLSLWIHTVSPQNYRMLLEDGYDWQTNSIHLGVIPHYHHVFYLIRTSDGLLWDDHVEVDPFQNRWTHLAYTYDGSAIHLYVNGIRIRTQSITGTVAASVRNLWVGFREQMAYIGFLEELRIWSTGRTEEEIRENIHIRLNGDEEGLVGYWRFDEGEGNVAVDASPNHHDGTLNGPEWRPSTAPVGDGASHTEIVGDPGVVGFNTAMLEMDFTQKTDTDTFVATVINSPPNGPQPQDRIRIVSTYWIVRRYGSGNFTADMTFFTGRGTLSAAVQSQPNDVYLYQRPFNSDSAWTFVDSSSSVTDSSVTFRGVRCTGQFDIQMKTSTPVVASDHNIPVGYRLFQNRPNPFNPSTVISYTIPEKAWVTVTVFDITGRKIETLLHAFQNAGTYSVPYVPENLSGGIYLYRIQAGGFTATRKMIIMQ